MKNKRRLSETLTGISNSDQGLRIKLEDEIYKWQSVRYGALSVLLSQMKFIRDLHQQHHWVSRGANYYADHQLFQRLYEEISGQIDDLAEKIVGLGGPSAINLQMVTETATSFCTIHCQSGTTVGSADSLPRASLRAEYSLLMSIEQISSYLDDSGMMTRGLQNFLDDLYDEHEKSIYLLQQRCD